MEKEQALELSGLVKQHFGLGDEPLAEFKEDEKKNKAQLSRLIAYLLEKDFQRLVQAMYRIDVPEKDFKQALELPVFEHVVATLTDLVFEREMLKVKTRIWYRNRN